MLESLKPEDRLIHCKEEFYQTIKKLSEILAVSASYLGAKNFGAQQKLNKEEESIATKVGNSTRNRRMEPTFNKLEAAVDDTIPNEEYSPRNVMNSLDNLRDAINDCLKQTFIEDLHDRLLKLAQMICYIQPRNKTDEAGRLISPITKKPIKHNLVYFSSAGYVIPIEDLVGTDLKQKLEILDFNSLSATEAKAIAEFKYKHVVSKLPLYRKVITQPYLASALTVLLTATPQYIQCLSNSKGYNAGLNLVSRWFVGVNDSIVGMINDSYPTLNLLESCGVSSLTSFSTLLPMLAMLGTGYYVHSYMVRLLNANWSMSVTLPPDQKIGYRDGMTDFDQLNSKPVHDARLDLMNRTGAPLRFY